MSVSWRVWPPHPLQTKFRCKWETLMNETFTVWAAVLAIHVVFILADWPYIHRDIKEYNLWYSSVSPNRGRGAAFLPNDFFFFFKLLLFKMKMTHSIYISRNNLCWSIFLPSSHLSIWWPNALVFPFKIHFFNYITVSLTMAARFAIVLHLEKD